MDLRLGGKVAMMAGASRGLGYAVARALAAEGAQVSILSRHPSAICEAARRIEQETAARVLAAHGDICSAEAIEQWHAATLECFGGVDLLLTNGGGPSPGPALGLHRDRHLVVRQAADPQSWLRSVAAIPLGRCGAPEEFGRAAAFLLSDAASYVTGPTLQVDRADQGHPLSLLHPRSAPWA